MPQRPNAKCSAGDSTSLAQKPLELAGAQVFLHELAYTLHKHHKLLGLFSGQFSNYNAIIFPYKKISLQGTFLMRELVGT